MRGLFLAAAILAVGCDTGGDDTDGTDATDDTDLTRAEIIASIDGDPVAGKLVFDENCRLCHKADGSGIGQDISDPTAFSEDDVITILLEGRGTMASYDVLTDDALADVTAYVLDGIGPE